MNRDRKILLIILFFTILLSVSFVNFTIVTEKREQILLRTKLINQKIQKLKENRGNISTEELLFYKDYMENEKKKFFRGDETDPYKFGIDIKESLEKEHLNIRSYRTIESEEEYLLEFSISGSSYDFFNFLKKLYDRDLNYSFPYFAVKNEKNGINVTFRIGYIIYE